MNVYELSIPLKTRLSEHYQVRSDAFVTKTTEDVLVEDEKICCLLEEENIGKELIVDWFYGNYNVLGVVEGEITFSKLRPKEFKNVLKIYLDEKPDTYKIASSLKKLFLETNVNINEYIENKNCISCRVVENEDWSKKWKENWKPFNITDKIVICPSWEEYQKKEKEIVIKIDPSNAFGTGVHATTSLCAKKIEEYLPCKLKTNPNLNLLDLGTGSGILSIIASILGCKDVLGVDIDESVIKTAIDNVNMNHVQNVKICEGTAKNIIGTYDIIVANILHNIIIKELDVWKKLLKKDGIMILSGILDEKKDLVLEKIKELNLKVVSVEQKKEWVCICVEG